MAYKSPTITLLLLHISIMVLSLSLFSSGYRPPFACDPANPTTTTYQFCNPSLPLGTRVADLIGRLKLAEKIRLLVNNAISVPRLGIRGYEWWSEALHGVSNTGPGVKFGGAIPGATSFPQVITTAASWNASLWKAIGEAVSTEGRAMYNTNQSGLTFWSPNVNILRDPRWGRAQETPGEDPYLTSQYAINYVRGLQGDDPKHLKTAACCKHYTAYDLDNWKGVDRYHFNALVTQQDLEETYNAPFHACVVKGKVASVMCSYNQVNGKPTCADPILLNDTIRGQWNLNGYIVSDCDSLDVFYRDQHYTSTPEDAAALALKAGLDLDCGPFLALYTQGAINAGKLTENDVNRALGHLLAVQMRLGMFDGQNGKYDYLGPSDVCTEAHQQLALEAAQQGIVLLQNNAQSLPLSSNKISSAAVIGPHADATITMIGNYAGIPCGYVTPFQGILKYVNGNNVNHVMGCTNVACPNNYHFRQAEDAAQNADATILFMGLSQAFEREFLDRTTLLLPGHQEELILKVASVSKMPIILVLMSGGPVDISFATNNPKIGAILWAGYPGQAGGQAIADVLFGTYTPGGQLINTWYPESYVDSVSMTNMNMRPNSKIGYPGRTYRFYNGETVYSFAHGLSYTTFTHTLVQGPPNISIPFTNSKALESVSLTDKTIRVSQMNCMALSLQVQVDVKNTGCMDGPYTLMAFSSREGREKHLVAFEKVMLAKGQKKRIKLKIDTCKYMSVVDKYGIRRIPMGQHILHIGGNLKDTMSVPIWAKPTFKDPVP